MKIQRLCAALMAIFVSTTPAFSQEVKWYEDGRSGVAEYKGPHCSNACPEAIKVAEAVCKGRGKSMELVKQCGCNTASTDNGLAQAHFVCKEKSN